MKVNPRHILIRWKKGIVHTLLALLFLTIGACDFDIPEKFEMPTWYLDLKIPLVQTRYQKKILLERPYIMKKEQDFGENQTKT